MIDLCWMNDINSAKRYSFSFTNVEELTCIRCVSKLAEAFYPLFSA